MIRASRRTRFVLLLVVIAVVAAGYALNNRHLDAGASTAVMLQTLSSNPQFQYFVIMPVCVIAAVATIRRESTPLRLIRHGSRMMLLSGPLWSLLRSLVLVAVTVFLAWTAVAMSTGGMFDLVTGIVAVGTLGGAVALLAIGFAATYWLLLPVRFVTDSSAAVLGTASAVWVFSVLPDVGVFMTPDPLNVAQYVTLRSVSERPQLAAALLLAAVVAFVLCAVTARWRDAGAARPHLNRRVTAVGIAVVVGVLGAIGVSSSVRLPAGVSPGAVLSATFIGAGLSVVAYLAGMTIILCLAIAATARFAADWTTRAPLLRIRYGTTTRWVFRVLAREAGWAVRAVLLVAVVIIWVRYAATGTNPFPAAGTEAVLLIRIVLAAVVISILLTAVVVLFGSEIAPLWAGCGILALGLVPPLNSPWNPLLGWAAQWTGSNALVAASVLAGTACILAAALAIRLTLTHESRALRVSH